MRGEAKSTISEIFDLIVGTSTGGILAAGLTVPGDGNRPRYSAAEMVKLYTEHGSEIFDRSLWKAVTSVDGKFEETYDHENLEELLKERLDDFTLKDCLTPVAITSYNIETREPYFFKTRKAHESDDRNHYLRDVARATSAAPSYFEPAEIFSRAEDPMRRVLVDGGVFANNPAMCAFVEAFSHDVKREDLLIVSLGTGHTDRKIPLEEAEDWGVFGWARPAISIMMDGMSDSVDHHLRHLLPDVAAGDKQRYFRFDMNLGKLADDDMDNARAANIQNLKDVAKRILSKQSVEFDRLIEKLKKP